MTQGGSDPWFGPSGAKLGGKTWNNIYTHHPWQMNLLKKLAWKVRKKCFVGKLWHVVTFQSCEHHFWGMEGKKNLRAKIQEAHGFVRFTDQTYTHERSTKCSKYFEGPWGARPLVTVEGPKCSKMMVTLFMLSVSKKLRFTNADAGPPRFYPKKGSERVWGGSGPCGKQQISQLFEGLDPF